MSGLYILLTPLVCPIIFNRLKKIIQALTDKNVDQLKIHGFFLTLMILVTLLLIYAIESVGAPQWD